MRSVSSGQEGGRRKDVSHFFDEVDRLKGRCNVAVSPAEPCLIIPAVQSGDEDDSNLRKPHICSDELCQLYPGDWLHLPICDDEIVFFLTQRCECTAAVVKAVDVGVL